PGQIAPVVIEPVQQTLSEEVAESLRCPSRRRIDGRNVLARRGGTDSARHANSPEAEQYQGRRRRAYFSKSNLAAAAVFACSALPCSDFWAAAVLSSAGCGSAFSSGSACICITVLPAGTPLSDNGVPVPPSSTSRSRAAIESSSASVAGLGAILAAGSASTW